MTKYRVNETGCSPDGKNIAHSQRGRGWFKGTNTGGEYLFGIFLRFFPT